MASDIRQGSVISRQSAVSSEERGASSEVTGAGYRLPVTLQDNKLNGYKVLFS